MFVSLPRRSSMGLTRGATRVGSLPAPMRRMLYGNNERRCKLDHSDSVNTYTHCNKQNYPTHRTQNDGM
jgi:hypothetical protein